MNHVICFCYSMHGCCIVSKYKMPKHEKLHENNGDMSCLSRHLQLCLVDKERESWEFPIRELSTLSF